MNIKRLIRAGFRYATNSDYRFVINSDRIGYYKWSDEKFIKRKFKAVMGKPLDLDSPQTFNEKLQWLKLYDRDSKYTVMVDKYLARDYVAKTIGEEYLIPLVGVWDDPDDIDFDALPNRFVFKCNHNSGTGMYICKDKSRMDVNRVKSDLRKGMKQDYYIYGREWPYKDVPRKIIAEKYMEDEETGDLRDYKFFCFNGEVKCFKVDFDRFSCHRANYYDVSGNLLHFGEIVCPPDYERDIKIPASLSRMISLAEKLSCGQPFLRVDFYDVNGKIYFGEMTFFPASGFGEFAPNSWDNVLGSWITLPDKK